MVFENNVGLLQSDLLRPGACLSRYQFLEIEHRIIGAALYPLLLSISIIHYDFDQHWRIGVMDQFAFPHQIHHVDFFGHWEIFWPLLYFTTNLYISDIHTSSMSLFSNWMWAICIYGNSHAFFPRALQLTHFYSRTYAFHICFLSSALFAQDFSHQAFNHIGFSLLFIFSTFFIYATYASFLFSPCLVSQYVWFFGAPSLINYNFNHLLYIYSMNFETNEPFDFQLGRLLAIIIMCEKNVNAGD